MLPFSDRCIYATVRAGVPSRNPVILKMETAPSSETTTCYTQCQVLLRTSVLQSSKKFLTFTAAISK